MADTITPQNEPSSKRGYHDTNAAYTLPNEYVYTETS